MQKQRMSRFHRLLWLAALAGVAPDLDDFRGENNLEFSHEVQAVVCLYASSDLTRIAMDLDAETQMNHTRPQACEAQYVNGVLSGLGILDDPEEAARANPITYVRGGEPPSWLAVRGLLQPCGAKDAEAAVVVAVRRRAVVAKRRPAAARRADPTPAPYHAVRTRRSIDRTVQARDVIRVPVEAPFPHVSVHVVETPGVRRV